MTVTVIAYTGSTFVECALHEVNEAMFEKFEIMKIYEDNVKIGRISDWELFKRFMDQYEMYCEAHARRIWKADSKGADDYSPCVAALKEVLSPAAVVAQGIDGLHNYIERSLSTIKDMPKMQPEVIERTELQGAIDKIQAAVNPSHYKAYIEDLQWLDAMSRIPTLRKPERFIAAVELQIRKYMDRNGGKDAPLQEFKKAHFYMSYIIKYMENDCKPIKAADIHDWLQSL